MIGRLSEDFHALLIGSDQWRKSNSIGFGLANMPSRMYTSTAKTLFSTVLGWSEKQVGTTLKLQWEMTYLGFRMPSNNKAVEVCRLYWSSPKNGFWAHVAKALTLNKWQWTLSGAANVDGAVENDLSQKPIIQAKKGQAKDGQVEESLTSSGGPQWPKTWREEKRCMWLRFCPPPPVFPPGCPPNTMQGEGGVIRTWFEVNLGHDSSAKDI